MLSGIAAETENAPSLLGFPGTENATGRILGKYPKNKSEYIPMNRINVFCCLGVLERVFGAISWSLQSTSLGVIQKTGRDISWTDRHEWECKNYQEEKHKWWLSCLKFKSFKVRQVTHNLAIQRVPGCTKYQNVGVARPVLWEGGHPAAKPECFHQLPPPPLANGHERKIIQSWLSET